MESDLEQLLHVLHPLNPLHVLESHQARYRLRHNVTKGASAKKDNKCFLPFFVVRGRVGADCA